MRSPDELRIIDRPEGDETRFVRLMRDIDELTTETHRLYPNCPFRELKTPCGPTVAIVSGTPVCQKHYDVIQRMERVGGIPDRRRP